MASQSNLRARDGSVSSGSFRYLLSDLLSLTVRLIQVGRPKMALVAVSAAEMKARSSWYLVAASTLVLDMGSLVRAGAEYWSGPWRTSADFLWRCRWMIPAWDVSTA